MKLTKSKLKQLIRESLGWGGFATDDNLEASDSPPAEKGLFDLLSKEEKELAEKMLWWWSEQIDKKGRESTLTGKDAEPFHRMWQDWDTIDLGMGTEADLKLIRDALINWPFWGERGDGLVPETKALASKIKAILSGDVPEEQEPASEPEDPRTNGRFALDWRPDAPRTASEPLKPSDRFSKLELDELLKRYREKQPKMKLTKSKLQQLILKEIENLLDPEDVGGEDKPVENMEETLKFEIQKLVTEQFEILTQTSHEQLGSKLSRLKEIGDHIFELSERLADLQGL